MGWPWLLWKITPIYNLDFDQKIKNHLLHTHTEKGLGFNFLPPRTQRVKLTFLWLYIFGCHISSDNIDFICRWKTECDSSVFRRMFAKRIHTKVSLIHFGNSQFKSLYTSRISVKIKLQQSVFIILGTSFSSVWLSYVRQNWYHILIIKWKF